MPILAQSWSHLGPPWLHLGSWPHLGPILAHLGSILDHSPILGPFWPHLGPILAPSWPRLAQSWPISAPSLSFLGHFLLQLLSCPSLSNFLSNFSLSAGGLPPPPHPTRFRSGFCPRRQGKRGRVFSSSRLSVTIAQELYNLTQQILLHSQTLFADLFPFFLVVTFFSDTQIKSPVRTVPRLCR